MTISSPTTRDPWHGQAKLRFSLTRRDGEPATIHQGCATAPLKLPRAFLRAGGRCELPLLHTAGGLVGGDRLSIEADLAADSLALLTSVAAQKVYGSVGRSRQEPAGTWARQGLQFRLGERADLEWLPQELVLFANGLHEQHLRVELAAAASFLGAEVVRLGRTAAGETLEEGRWRSCLEIRRHTARGPRWEVVDRLELSEATRLGDHGLAGQPVFGSLVWAAPEPLGTEVLNKLLDQCRRDRGALPGRMACGALEQGLVARYHGPSCQAARHWFTRIWARVRAVRGLPPPELPRVWPFQEQPLA